MKTLFVLGGGGHRGAHQVGMLRALLAAGIRPDAVLGASVGAINGAVLAADPTDAAVARLEQLWSGLGENGVFADSNHRPDRLRETVGRQPDRPTAADE